MKRTVVGAGLLAVLVALAATVGGATATMQADDGEVNASMGAEVSSFMQASSAEAESEVDDGIFDAAWNRTDDLEERRALVEQRRQRLQQRQAKLTERRAQISAEDGVDVKDRALATHVDVGAAHLERSVNGTERAAQAAGLNASALEELRSSARDLRGAEVAELARNLTDRPGQRGSPDGVDVANRGDAAGADERGPSNGPERTANRSNDGAAESGPDEPGPPEDASGDGGDGDDTTDE